MSHFLHSTAHGDWARQILSLDSGRLLVFFALATVVGVISLMPSPGIDLWWHVRVGELIAQEGRIPTTNRFAWTVPPDTPYVYATWLGDLLLAGLHRLGGIELLIFTRNLLATCLLVMVAMDTIRRNRTWRFASFAVLPAGFLTLASSNLRPQMWAWAPFGLFVLLLGRYADGRLRPRWLLALPLLMAFWVNVHGSFVLGLALVGAYVVGELARRKVNPDRALGWDRLRWLGLAALGTSLATLVNPLGPGIFSYVRELTGNSAVRGLIVEWQPPSPNGPVFVAFYLSILALLVAWAHLRRPPSPSDVLLTCGFLWLAWTGARHVFWYGIVVMPILAQALAQIQLATTAPARARSSALNGLLAALLLIPLIVVQPWFGHAPALLVHTPTAAVEYLRTNPGGKLFSELGYASYLIWALPEQTVFVDPRVELFPRTLWEDYVEIGGGRGAMELLERHGVERVLLSRVFQQKLADTLAASPGWQREYADGEAEIWRGPSASR